QHAYRVAGVPAAESNGDRYRPLSAIPIRQQVLNRLIEIDVPRRTLAVIGIISGAAVTDILEIVVIEFAEGVGLLSLGIDVLRWRIRHASKGRRDDRQADRDE